MVQCLANAEMPRHLQVGENDRHVGTKAGGNQPGRLPFTRRVGCVSARLGRQCRRPRGFHADAPPGRRVMWRAIGTGLRWPRASSKLRHGITRCEWNAGAAAKDYSKPMAFGGNSSAKDGAMIFGKRNGASTANPARSDTGVRFDRSSWKPATNRLAIAFLFRMSGSGGALSAGSEDRRKRWN